MDFTISIDVNAPSETVWQVMSDVEHWHEWTASVKGVRLFTRGPIEPGRHALVRQPKLPPAVWKVAEVNAGRNFIWTSGLPGAWVTANHSVTAIPGGTRATLSLHYDGWLGNLIARWTTGLTNRYLRLEADGLKARSETNARLRHDPTKRAS